MPLPRDVAAHVAQRRRMLDSTAVLLAAVWQGVNIDDVDGYLTRVLPPVNAAIAAQTSVAAAWIARRTGQPARTVPVDYRRLRGGKTEAEVYRRPLLEVRRQLGRGVEYGRARDIGGRRLAVAAQTDAQSAYADQVHRLLRGRGSVHRYRRAVSGVNACSRCVTAAGQLLSTDQVLPRHPACRCSIVPLVDGDDPGALVADGAEAPEIDVEVREHGELGPVLVDASHGFSDLGDV